MADAWIISQDVQVRYLWPCVTTATATRTSINDIFDKQCNSCYWIWVRCQIFLCLERHTNETKGSIQCSIDPFVSFACQTAVIRAIALHMCWSARCSGGHGFDSCRGLGFFSLFHARVMLISSLFTRRKVLVKVTNNFWFSSVVQVYTSEAEGGQHSQVKLNVYFKLDYKFGYELRKILFVFHCFASIMVLLCI